MTTPSATPIAQRRPSASADDAALAEHLAQQWGGCYRVALAVLHDPGLSEDAAQEAFLELVAARRRGDAIAHVGAWLRATTVNKARMRARGEGRRAKREQAVGMRRWHASARQERSLDELCDLTGHLSETLRLPLELHFGLGHTQAEIAQLLDCPVGTVASRIRRGLERIRERLAAHPQVLALTAVAGLITAAYDALRTQGPPAPDVSALTPARAARPGHDGQAAPPERAQAGSGRARRVAGAVAGIAAAGLIALGGLLVDGPQPRPERASAPTTPPRAEASPAAGAPTEETDAEPTVAPSATGEPAVDPAPRSTAAVGPLRARRFPPGQLEHTGAHQLAVSRTGARVATASAFPVQLLVWDVGSRQRLHELRGLGGAPLGDHPLDGLEFLDDRLLVSLQRGELLVWDAETGELVHRLPAEDTALGPFARLVALARQDGRHVGVQDDAARVLDVFSGASRPATPEQLGEAVRLRPDPSAAGSLAIELRTDGAWRRSCSLPVSEVQLTKGPSLTRLDADRDRLYVAFEDELALVDLAQGEVLVRRPAWSWPTFLISTADPRWLVVGSAYELTVHDAETLEPRRELLGAGVVLEDLALLPDDRTLVAVGGGELRMWDLVTGLESTPRGRGLRAGVQQVLYGAAGELISVDRAGQIAFWDAAGQVRAAAQLPLPLDEARRAAGLPEDVSLEGRSREELAELGLDPDLALAGDYLESPRLAWSCEGQGVTLAPDALWIAVRSYWESERVRGLGLHRVDLAGHYLGRVAWPVDDPVSAAAFSPDGRRLAVVTASGTRVFSLPSLAPVGEAGLPSGDLPTLSADGSRLALETGNAEITVFDVPTGAVVATVGAGGPARACEIGWGFSGEDVAPMEWVSADEAAAPDTPESVVGVQLSRDGRTALLAHTAAGASAWDLDTGERLWRSDLGYGIAISHDGLAVLLQPASADADDAEDRVAVVRRLDLRSGEQVGPILLSESASAGVWCVALSPDGRRLGAGSVDGHGGGSVLRWDLPPR